MKSPEIFENFLPEELLNNFVNQLDNPNMQWNIAEEVYESDIALDNGKLQRDDKHEEVLKTHNISKIDIKYDIKNVILLKDRFGNDVNTHLQNNAWPNIDTEVRNTLGVKIPLKSKVNISFCQPVHTSGGFHIDIWGLGDLPSKTLLLYLNDNNGGTIFEDGTFIKQKYNRAVLFDGNMKHSPVSQTDNKKRIVLNYNFL